MTYKYYFVILKSDMTQIVCAMFIMLINAHGGYYVGLNYYEHMSIFSTYQSKSQILLGHNYMCW